MTRNYCHLIIIFGILSQSINEVAIKVRTMTPYQQKFSLIGLRQCSIFTKLFLQVDENLMNGHLLDNTKSRMHQPRIDDSSMTSKNLEDQFNSSLRSYPRLNRNDQSIELFDNIRSKFEIKSSKSGVNISQSTFSSSQSSVNRQAAGMSLSRNRSGKSLNSAHINKSDLTPSDDNEWIERNSTSKRNLSSSAKSKRSESIVKPFPEYLRAKLRESPYGTTQNKESVSPCMSLENDESDRYHLHDKRAIVAPLGMYQHVASPLLDSPNYEKTQYVSHNAFTDDDEGGGRYDKIYPSSLPKQGQIYRNFDENLLNNLRQSEGYDENHSMSRMVTNRGFVCERKINEADSGRNLEVEFHNHCYNQQNNRTSDSLPDVEDLEASSDYPSTSANVQAYPHTSSRPSSRDRSSSRSRTELPEGARFSNGYLESALEMHQNAPLLAYSTESYLGRLEGRLLTRTESFKNRLSASRSVVERPPSPLFKQPVFRPWGQGRDGSPEKRIGRTFSNGSIIDSSKRSSATGGLSNRPQSAPSGNRTGLSQFRSQDYLNGRHDELHMSGNRYHNRNHAIDDIPLSALPHFRKTPFDSSKEAAAISSSFKSPIESTLNNSSPDMSRYGLFSRPLSAGSQAMLGMRSRSSEMRQSEEYPFRGRTEGKQLQQSQPTIQRLSNSRLVAGHRPSTSPSSSHRGVHNKFLRDIHAGVTPGLREHSESMVNSSATDSERNRERSHSRGKERSRPVFRPSGTVRDVSLKDYDDRINECLNTSHKDATKDDLAQDSVSKHSCNIMERNLRYSSDINDGNPQNTFSDNDFVHCQYSKTDSKEGIEFHQAEENGVDHSDIRAAAMEVMMNMSFKLSPRLKQEQLMDEAEDIDDITSRDGQDVDNVEWVVEKDVVLKSEREEVNKGEIFAQIIDEGSSLDDKSGCYPERNNAPVSHSRLSDCDRPMTASMVPCSVQEYSFEDQINSDDQVQAATIGNQQLPQKTSTQVVWMEDAGLNEVPRARDSTCRAPLNTFSEQKSPAVDNALGSVLSGVDANLSDNQMMRLPLDSKPSVRSTGMSRPTVPLKIKAGKGPVLNSVADPDPILPLGVNPFARTPVQAADLKIQSLPETNPPKTEISSVPQVGSSRKEVPRDRSTIGSHVIPASVGLELLKTGVLVNKVD